MIKELTIADFNTRICDLYNFDGQWRFLGERPVVIDFYASWCDACRGLAPVLEELADEYAGRIDFYKVYIEQEQQLAAIFEVRSVPTVFFIPEEGMPQMMTEIHSKAQLKEVIEKLLLV